MAEKSNLRKFFLGRSVRDYKRDQQKAQENAEEDTVTRLAEAGGITLHNPSPTKTKSNEGATHTDKRLVSVLSKRGKREETPKRAALMQAMKVLYKQKQEIFSDLSSERRESLRMMAEFMLGVGRSQPKSVVESTIVTTPTQPSQGKTKEKPPAIRYGVKLPRE